MVLTAPNSAVSQALLKQDPSIVPLSVRYGDHTSYHAFSEEIKTADVLIHAGALLSSQCPGYERDLTYANALLPSDLLMRVGAIRPKLRTFLISSMSLLGPDGRYKDPEEMTPYAFSKYTMEKCAQAYRYLDITLVRFSTLFYRDPARDGLSRVIHDAKTKGRIRIADCERDWLPVDKAAEGLLQLISPKEFSPGPRQLNLISGQPRRLSEVAEYLQQKHGVKVDHYLSGSDDDVCSRFPNYSRHVVEVDIFKEVEDYYARVDFCDRNQG